MFESCWARQLSRALGPRLRHDLLSEEHLKAGMSHRLLKFSGGRVTTTRRDEPPLRC